jgi:uncharacterized protein YndB with AHSA1/START domain
VPWVIAAIVIIVAVSALVLAVGSMLPKGHLVSRMAHFNRPPDEIWDTITAFGGQVSWRSDLLKTERLPNRGGREVWQETDRRGQTLTMETVESVPPRRLVRRIADENLGFGGSWTIQIAEFGEVTSLTITESGEIYNPVYRFVTRFITGYAATVDQYLRALAQKLGVDVNITSV